MATKAKTAKKTTLSEKLEYLQRERDQINKERIQLVADNDALKRQLENQRATVIALQREVNALEERLLVAERNNSPSRHWVLRKLGL